MKVLYRKSKLIENPYVSGAQMKMQEWEDLTKLPEFKNYTDVPAGFEIVKGNFRSNPHELIETLNIGTDHSASALWDNTGMPMENDWDEEIKHLNDVQGALGDFNKDHRAVRCMIASYNMMHYNYKKSIATMLGALNSLKLINVLPVGWHVPWLPPNQAKRIEMLDVYIDFLQAWEQKEKSLTIRTSKQYKNDVLRNIYSKLGDWTSEKRSYVLLFIEKLESFRSIYTMPSSFWTEREISQYDILAKNKLDRLIGAVETETGASKTKDELLIRIENFREHIWHHSFFEEVDLWLEWVGKGTKVNFKSITKKYDEPILNACTGFFGGLNEFLSQAVIQSSVSGPGSEHPKEIRQYISGLTKMFGKASKVQVWLLACLWKTMKHQLLQVHESEDYPLKIQLENEWLFQL
jgi:hypothetical protein